MSSRDSLDSIVEEAKRLGVKDTEGLKQAIHQWALDIIGEDEALVKPNWPRAVGRSYDNRKYREVRNALRKEQRAKLKGDIDE